MLCSSRERGDGEGKDKPFLFFSSLIPFVWLNNTAAKYKWNWSLFQATNGIIAKNIVHNLDSEIEIIENKLIYWLLFKRGRIYQSSDIPNTISISNSVESLFQCWSSVMSMFNIFFSRNRCLSVPQQQLRREWIYQPSAKQRGFVLLTSISCNLSLDHTRCKGARRLFFRFPCTQFLYEEALQHFSTAVVWRVSLVEVSTVVKNLGYVADKRFQGRIRLGIHAFFNSG